MGGKAAIPSLSFKVSETEETGANGLPLELLHARPAKSGVIETYSRRGSARSRIAAVVVVAFAAVVAVVVRVVVVVVVTPQPILEPS